MCKITEILYKAYDAGLAKLGVGIIGFIGFGMIYVDFTKFLNNSVQTQVQLVEVMRSVRNDVDYIKNHIVFNKTHSEK